MVSKAVARSTETAQSDDFDYDLDDTAPLPTLPEWSKMSKVAANDESFADEATNEQIERLIALTESIDKHLKTIAEATVATKAKATRSRTTKKKRVTKKRASKKTATKKRATKKTASQ